MINIEKEYRDTMARKIKFALEMADGTFISVLEDLQKHIKNNDELKKLVEYFLDGRLEKWLLDRYYEEEAKALQTVDFGSRFGYSING